MRRLLFLSLLLSWVAFSDASTWTLNRSLLESRLPSSITTEELVRVLEKEGVKVLFQTPSSSSLWEGNRVSVSLALTPFAPYHLWIAVKGRQTLDACTTDELAELYEAIWKSRKALAETTGADSFMIFATEQKRNGKNSSTVGVEIIPSGFKGSQGVMDAVEKNALNEYVFYNHFSVRNVFQSPEIIAAIRETLKALVSDCVNSLQYLRLDSPEKVRAERDGNLHQVVERERDLCQDEDRSNTSTNLRNQTLEPTVQTEMPQGRWSQKLLHHKDALHQNLQSIHAILAQMGALVEGEMPAPPATEEKVHEIQIDLDRCAFCNPKVIEKQIVCEWKGIQVLMSHKPISPYGNFLILPKRHSCAWDLTKEEAIASFEAVIALKKMLLETAGSNDWICYIQDGPAVGQTVPHTHIHFYILPDPLKSAITSLQHIHNQRPILSYEEMRANCERAKFLLSKQLNCQTNARCSPAEIQSKLP